MTTGTSLGSCRTCGRELLVPTDIGWECECGVIVCALEECINEHFRGVADGEAMRCLSCGAIL